MATIQRLPPEMLLHIISFLTLPDLLRLGRTCRYLHELCDSEAAWHHIYTPLPLLPPAPGPARGPPSSTTPKGCTSRAWDAASSER
ncbi:F-box only protein 24-like [Aptenodytes patagonicus]|uniref:F-box only protein 24-like n=1 Tax=Aptenodytes patagonicus TaxID=9234 RepID=UPI003FA00511